MTKIKMTPGMKPKPDDQGKADTCTRHGMGKGVTGGLHDGTFGQKLDVNQESVTTLLVSKTKSVGGCWPIIFNMMTILVFDRSSSEYFNVKMKVSQCSFAELEQKWNNFKFVVVYKTAQGLHCVYVDKVVNGKLRCINSTGNINQFPQLRPEKVDSIWKIGAAVEKTSRAPPNPNMQRTTSQLSLNEQVLQAEIVRLKKENEELKKKEKEELKKKEKEELMKKEKEKEELKKKEMLKKREKEELKKKEMLKKREKEEAKKKIEEELKKKIEEAKTKAKQGWNNFTCSIKEQFWNLSAMHSAFVEKVKS